MSMYLRVKRLKATYFLNVEPNDTVLAAKNKLIQMLGHSKEASDMRLQVAGKAPGAYVPLEDNNVLEQVGLVDDSAVFLSFWVPDGSSEGGSWEPVSIPQFDPLHDEAEAK
ncbi:hypothetical protein HDV05_008203 [Chytridiales sp. JEL 0842]|nr:hypothetical protein HDV05_008203 [Chytridiales sp. JEL 0842]